MKTSLQARYRSLHREMVAQFEQVAAVENHWLMYLLLGWEILATCAVSHYFLRVEALQVRWPYVVLWLGQIFVAIGTIKLVTGRPVLEESPLEPINKRIWLMFMFLCINVAVLNVVAGHPIFVFLPVLAVLSSFAFTVMTALISPRFTLAGIVMFVTGILIARFEEYGFLIYGLGWFLILEVLGLLFLVKRRQWLPTEMPQATEPVAK